MSSSFFLLQSFCAAASPAESHSGQTLEVKTMFLPSGDHRAPLAPV